MGNKKMSPSCIQARELFTNQVCPKCESYLGIQGIFKAFNQEESLQAEVYCLGENCNYHSTRELI